MTFALRYSRDLVEELLPAVWDEELAREPKRKDTAPDHDMPKGPPPNPAHAGQHWVHVADMKRAWERAELSREDRQVLWLRYHLDSYQAEIAEDLGVTQSTVSRRLDRALNKVGLFLNGRPFGDDDDKDEED